MNKLPPLFINDFINGVVHENVVSEAKAPRNSVNEAINVHFDTMGAVTSRYGTTLLGNQISAGTDILGLHQFLDEGIGTDDTLVAVNGTGVYWLDGTTWTLKRSVTAGYKARFTNFLDRMMMVNGIDATQGWDGASTSSFGTTNLADAPVGYYIDNYRSRVWIGNTQANPSRVYYSSVASSTGTITWDQALQFIDVSPGDGEDITGIKRSPRALLIFKPGHMYRIFSINDADPDPQINVGTYSNESVVEAKDGVYFFDWNNAAIHKYDGGAPIEVSKPIKPYLEAVTLANRDDVCGWADTDHVYESIGDVTVNGVTIGNAVVRYTISTETWTIYSYPTQILCAHSYDDGLTREPIVGDSDGNILRFNNGITDNGSPIVVSMVTRWNNLSGVLSWIDTITKMAAMHRNAQGIRCEYQVDSYGRESEWKSMGIITKAPTTEFEKEISGNKVRFRVSGSLSGQPLVFEGFEVIDSFTD